MFTVHYNTIHYFEFNSQKNPIRRRRVFQKFCATSQEHLGWRVFGCVDTMLKELLGTKKISASISCKTLCKHWQT